MMAIPRSRLLLVPKPSQIDWSIALLWVGMIVFGIAELGFAVYGFAHALHVVAAKLGGLL